MNYRLVESERTKADGSYWDNSNGRNHVIYKIISLSGCHFSLSLHYLFSYSLRILSTLLPLSLSLSQGNQWEPVTVCEQRHYSGDSLCPMKHKNPETAELIESGGVKVSVSSRTEQQRMWLKASELHTKSHIDAQTTPELCVPFGLSYFCERASSCQEQTKHKRNTLQRAVNYIYMSFLFVVGIS